MTHVDPQYFCFIKSQHLFDKPTFRFPQSLYRKSDPRVRKACNKVQTQRTVFLVNTVPAWLQAHAENTRTSSFMSKPCQCH